MTIRNLIAALAITLSSAFALAAPFWPSFHNVPAQTFFDNFSYYPNQGLGLQTLSLYRAGNQTLAAGSFDSSVQGPWYALGNMTTAGFSQAFSNYGAQGFRPREISVMIDAQGQPRFSAIWKKRTEQGYYTYINMTDADLNQKWNTLVTNQGYRVEDYVSYNVNGQRRHAAIYVRDGKGFYFFTGMTQASFGQKFNELAAQGFYPTSFNAVMTPQGERYACVWMKATGATAMFFNMSAAGYQQKFDYYNSLGFKVKKIHVYGNGSRFSAIWKK